MKVYLVSLMNQSLWRFHHFGEDEYKVSSQMWKLYDLFLASEEKGDVIRVRDIGDLPECILLIHGGYIFQSSQLALEQIIHMPHVHGVVLGEDDCRTDFRYMHRIPYLGLLTNHTYPMAHVPAQYQFKFTVHWRHVAIKRMEHFDNSPEFDFCYVGDYKAFRKSTFDKFGIMQVPSIYLVGRKWMRNGVKDCEPFVPFKLLMKYYQKARFQLCFSDPRWIPFQTLVPRVIESLWSRRPVLFHETQVEATPGLIPTKWVFRTREDLQRMKHEFSNYIQLYEEQWHYFKDYFLTKEPADYEREVQACVRSLAMD